MVYVRRWIRWLLIALAIYISIAMYGTLRTHGIEPLMSLSICLGYGVGYFHIMAELIAAVKKKL